jgi:DNA-binding transcriptional ArsR family regulator
LVRVSTFQPTTRSVPLLIEVPRLVKYMLDYRRAADILNQMLNHSLTRVFHALADPTRRAIVQRLASGEAPVKELAKPLAMSLAAVVQHIQVLEQSGVITTHKSGRVRTCRINLNTLCEAETWIAQRRALWERRFDRLGDVLAEPINPIDGANENP